jgi:hypothetical protein
MEVTELQSRTAAVLLEQIQSQSPTELQWRAEVHLKRENALIYYVGRFRARPTLRVLLRRAQSDGARLSRPFHLTSPWDGEVDYCIFALYDEACNALHLDAQNLYETAYPFETYCRATAEFGRWQGITSPRTWDLQALEQLLEQLTQINHHTLVAHLRTALERAS